MKRISYSSVGDVIARCNAARDRIRTARGSIDAMAHGNYRAADTERVRELRDIHEMLAHADLIIRTATQKLERVQPPSRKEPR